MHWQEFLDCARRYVSSSTEGDWRSAVSRAYYAVFHHFREWLRNRGVKLGGAGQAHSNLYLGLFNCGVGSIQQIARDIDDLRFARADADYDLMNALDQKTAQALLTLAEKVLVDFRSILPTMPAQQIADGTKNYLISIGRITP